MLGWLIRAIAFPFLSLCEDSMWYSPEVQVVHASLHISHVNVIGEEIHGRRRSSREHFEEVGQSLARSAGLWRWRARRHDCCVSFEMSQRPEEGVFAVAMVVMR